MEIVQTFWSCNNRNILENNYGWISPEYNIMSWTLSCLLLQKRYPHIKLYTDTAGAKLFIDKLKLPYLKVFCTLDKFNYENSGLWALAKIHTYSIQKSPFLHIDGDVFIWESFKSSLLNKDLIVQNIETDHEYYNGAIENICKQLNYIPNEVLKNYHEEERLRSYNAGILGGKDLDFIFKYTTKAFQFVNRNLNYLNNHNSIAFNTIYEQFLLYILAKKEYKNVGCYIKKHIDNVRYIGFANFLDVPYEKKYLHLHGNYKKNINVCRQLSNRLLYEFPEQYFKIITLFKDNNLPLYEDNIKFEDRITSKISGISKSNPSIKNNIINQRFPKNSYNSRSKYLKSHIKNLLKHFDKEVIKHLLSDIKKLEKSIINYIKIHKFKKFDNYYRHNILTTYQIESIYKNSLKNSSKRIVLNPDIKIVKNNFNWLLLNSDFPNLILQIEQILNTKFDNNETVIIPEYFNDRFSLFELDDFDSIMLNSIKKSKKISTVLEFLISKYDNDSNCSIVLIENLFYDKLKTHLDNKIIRYEY